MEKAVVLLSGGINSAVAAATLAESHELYMLFAQYHQRPLNHELHAYEALCKHFNVRHHWRVDLSHFKQVGGNSFVDPKREIEQAAMLDEDIAGTFVAMLMPTLFDVAASFAFRIGAKCIVTGLSENIDNPPPGNNTLYPDNRRELIQNYQYMLESALPERSKVTVEAPVMDFDRAEIIRLAQRLNVPLASTWSCYQDGDKPCTTCFGCASRAAGFLNANIPDPLILPEA